MKYIRTKTGIYEDAGTDALGLRCVRYNGCKITLSQDDDKIVKEADTIEELCDNGVIFGLNGQPTITYYLNEKKHWLMGDRKYMSAFYGAIWTEKGLIYVAKMNEKGELELL